MDSTITILFWCAAMFILQEIIKQGSINRISDHREYRVSWLFAVFTFFPVVMMATFRGYVADSHLYIAIYKGMPNDLSGLLAYLPSVTKDKGFALLSGIIKCIFKSNDHIIYFFVIAALQGALMVYIYRKYSVNYVLSVFLFIVSTDYLSWMFNGIRQFTAVMIIFASTPLILEKKWIPSILLILLASTMHQSALMMIPIVVIVQGKAWNGKTILFLSAALVAVAFVDQFTNILDDMMQETQYANMVTDWTLGGDDGTNPIRVLVYAVPTILSLVGMRYIHNQGGPLINFCANMSIVSTGLYIISMFTSGIFIGRLPIYASLYNYILLPWEIKHMFTKRTAHLVTAIMIVAYLGFYWYQTVITW